MLGPQWVEAELEAEPSCPGPTQPLGCLAKLDHADSSEVGQPYPHF